MEAYQLLKQARIEKGFSMDSFSAATGIKKRSLTYYESGERQIENLMVYKCLSLLSPLGIDPESFFDESLHYKSDCDNRIRVWRQEHPRVLEYASLRHQSYDRIMHMKYRNSISPDQHDMLIHYYKQTFDYLSNELGERKELTDTEYETYYLSFLGEVKTTLYAKDNLSEPLSLILKEYFKSEFAAQTFTFLPNDFSSLIGYTKFAKLRKILSGEVGLDSLTAISALRLCYILGLPFEKVFELGKNTCI